MYTERRFIANV